MAAARVAARRRAPDHRPHRVDDVLVLLAERRGEPAADRRLHERLHPLRLRRLDALLPERLGLGRDTARRVAERQAQERPRRGERQRLADHAAHRQADPVRARDAERVQQRAGVVGQLRQRVGAARRVGTAVPARVVAQHAIAGGQRLHLRLPHRQIGGQRVAQRHHGGAGRAIEGVVHADAVGGDLHSCLLTRGSTSRAMRAV